MEKRCIGAAVVQTDNDGKDLNFNSFLENISPSFIILWGRADKIFNSGFLNLLITFISPRPLGKKTIFLD